MAICSAHWPGRGDGVDAAKKDVCVATVVTKGNGDIDTTAAVLRQMSAASQAASTNASEVELGRSVNFARFELMRRVRKSSSEAANQANTAVFGRPSLNHDRWPPPTTHNDGQHT